MKAIAYNISPKDKEWLILANHKKHDITIITNSLCEDTLAYANGKEALILLNEDPLPAAMIQGLSAIGIKYIATASFETGHIDIQSAIAANLKIANIPFENGGSLEVMHQVVRNLDNWGNGRCVGNACCCGRQCVSKTTEKEI